MALSVSTTWTCCQTSPWTPSSPPHLQGSPSSHWELTAGDKSPSCGTKTQNRPVESPGCFQRAAGSPAERCRTSLSSPAATPWRLSTLLLRVHKPLKYPDRLFTNQIQQPLSRSISLNVSLTCWGTFLNACVPKNNTSGHVSFSK